MEINKLVHKGACAFREIKITGLLKKGNISDIENMVLNGWIKHYGRGIFR